ncbi:NusA antitermination factor [Candidatus Koribacter versatilis Ellin345]|uniref:Transcription termination/antitermination protein NusA n=1 Tax=Koribacter versatilis (strain Ellin345) TaxID=204669 RepID=Q1IIT2_KORVE|nr:transcription termination factor NusA [Candidatus Koribacter versatilis]ABF43218.1 NusA antitermination factor [Candidatus Koribacter versatilis Ellin345]
MASELYNVIDALSREKGIDPQVVVTAVEDAIVVATRKFYKTGENFRAVLDKESGQIRAYAVRQVVINEDELEDPATQVPLEEARELDPAAEVGGELLIEKKTDMLGRIAAQLAKQVIFQKVREAERDTVYNEYIGRVGEIVNATMKRNEGPDLIWDIGKAEARMPKKEQSRLESFAIGERVRVVITRVEKASKGPQVIVSRAAPELVSHLFQTEVPEIYDNTVVIRAIAREAGERTKIAVMSKDKDVDAVGACVGMKGMRVQSIIRELRGEKIDIIEYHEDAVTFAEKALQPAKVSRVTILESGDKHLEVIVDDTQLSLAIGKKGQNVRLAAKLLGWKIDIKSEEEKRQEVEQQMSALVNPSITPLDKVPDLGEAIIEKLSAAGINSVEALADMTPEQLEEVPGIGPKTVDKIFVAVNAYFSALDAAAEAAEAASAEGATTELSASDTTDNQAQADELGNREELTGSAGQAGDDAAVSGTPEASEESVKNLVDTEQSYEAAAVSGVENAPPADEAEVTTHGEQPGEDDLPAEEK